MKILAGLFGKSDLEDESKGVIQDRGTTEADVTIDMGSKPTTESSKPLLLLEPDYDRAKLANSLLGQKVPANKTKKRPKHQPEPRPFRQQAIMEKIKSVLKVLYVILVGVPLLIFSIMGGILFLVGWIVMIGSLLCKFAMLVYPFGW